MVPGLPSTRTKALQFYRVLLGKAGNDVTQNRRIRRWLARNDLFYLLVVELGRRDMNRDWLFERCREVQAFPNNRLDLWAREHYKSTVITFGLSIMDILASHGDEPEPRYGGREVTIGIFSHTRPIAKGFLKQIKTELENNSRLHELFPDILWGDNAPQATWSEDGGIIVRRKTNPKEATVEAWGLVDGQPTGKHFFVRVYDDVVTRESVYTPDQIIKTTDAWELSDNLGTEGGWVRYIGTRYHAFDTYQTMMDRKVVVPRIYPCTRDGKERFEPDNCVLMKPETLAHKRAVQGPYTFGAQMLQNPTADKAQGFKEDWAKFWTVNGWKAMNRYILVDPSSGRRRAEKGADNDFTVFMVVGLGMDGKYRVLDIIRDRLQLNDRARMLFELHRKWKPLKVGYEQYGMQADIEHIKGEQERLNYSFEIVELGGAMPKVDRIKRLVPVFEQGKILLPDTATHQGWDGAVYDGTQVFLREEFNTFPVCKHDDMLDCLARILEPELRVEWPEDRPQAVSDNDWADEALSRVDGAGGDAWMTA
jgi:phage terminase large subunit-like protein